MEEILIEKVEKGSSRMFEMHIARLPTGTMINVRVIIYRGNENGPVLLLSGGLHGDEVNGTEIIRRLMLENALQPLRGTIIAIPVINIYGFLNFARDMPDGKDANRSFPGTRNGSLASRIAWHMRNRILPLIDYGLDFHTGGASRINHPQVRCDFSDNMSMSLAKEFGAPFIVNSNLIPGSLRNEAKALGKTIIVFEGGKTLKFHTQSINEGMAGTKRILSYFKMTDEEPPKSHESIVIPKRSWVRAEFAGLFQYTLRTGNFIKEGDIIGTITDPYNEHIHHIVSPHTGYLLGLNHSPVVNAGDALLNIGLQNGKIDNADAEITK